MSEFIDQPSALPRIVVLVSANGEWLPTKEALQPTTVSRSPYGEYFIHAIASEALLFFHAGWIAAAAGSTEHVINRWDPELLINLGTCGGIKGRVERGELLLITRLNPNPDGERVVPTSKRHPNGRRQCFRCSRSLCKSLSCR